MNSTDTTEQTAREILIEAFTEPIDDCNEWIESPLDCGARNALAALAAAGIRLVGDGQIVVDARRFERLRVDAQTWKVHCQTENGRHMWVVQPGDLDPITTQPGTAGDAQEHEG